MGKVKGEVGERDLCGGLRGSEGGGGERKVCRGRDIRNMGKMEFNCGLVGGEWLEEKGMWALHCKNRLSILIILCQGEFGK